jgi:DNA primase
MPLIPEPLIDEVLSRADIVELIGHYVPLKRAGRHFKANCPFHKEKSPSFMVNTEKQIFHCFGCGVGGNIFSFLMLHDRLTFPEAVRQLAERTGVRLPESGAAEAAASQEPLRALLDKTCQYYERRLQEPGVGQAARDYLAKRGVSPATAQQFRLGLASEGWDQLLTSATAKGVAREQLEAVGLIVPGKSGGYYDRFRNRLLFPIMDLRNRIVGFGGRSLDGREPKYLNSPETVLYSKGRQLFGLAQAKAAVAESKTAVLVEGYFDCVVLFGGGIENVVSPLGTALTPEQAKLLRRYAEQVILAFDADAAGEQATIRGLEVLLGAGFQVRVAALPEGVDPDECLRAYGRPRFDALLQSSVNCVEFMLHTASRRFPLDRLEGKAKAAQFVLPIISNVADRILRSEYVRLLAQRLQLDETAVMAELARLGSRPAAQEGEGRAPRSAPVATGAPGPERLLTALVLENPKRWEQVAGRISLSDLSDATYRELLGTVLEMSAEGRSPSASQLVSRVTAGNQGSLVTQLVELAQSMGAPEEAFEDCVRRVQQLRQQRRLSALREQIRMAQEARRDTETQQLLADYQEALAAPVQPVGRS